jgi:hypothetical protein
MLILFKSFNTEEHGGNRIGHREERSDVAIAWRTLDVRNRIASSLHDHDRFASVPSVSTLLKG